MYSKFHQEYREAVTELEKARNRAGEYEHLPPALYDELVTARLKLWIVREQMRHEAEDRARRAAVSNRRFLEIPGAPTPRYRPRRTVRRTNV